MKPLIAQPERFRQIDLALVLAVIAIGVRVLWPGINAPIWLDEQMIAINIRDRDFLGLIGKLDNEQSAPLGWLWVERFLFVVLGQADWVLRLAPLAFGIGTVVLAWGYGRRWLGPVGSAALVALTGFNYAMIVYSSEIKHYGADIFCAFLLIALARWVLEQPHSYRRHLWWWGAALVASWLSIGAIAATPGIGLVLVITAGWRQPFPTWIRMAVPGLAWLISLAAHYLLALRPASQNDYLNTFWASLGFPPAGANALETLRWFVKQGRQLLESTLYLNLGLESTLLAKGLFAVFTALFLAGLVIAFRRGTAFGFVLCAPLISAMLLALLRVIPMFGRLSLWLVPAIFIAVAQAVDFKPARVPAARWVAPAAFLVLLIPLFNSVKERVGAPEFDDRAAIAWLRERHRPGDLTLLVAPTSRAREWYDVDRRLSPSLGVVSLPSGPDCDPALLGETVRRYPRVLVYAGARLYPYHETHRVLETQLATIGTITERARFGTDGATYVVELNDSETPAVAAGGDCVKFA